jgi:hypothetical protein
LGTKSFCLKPKKKSRFFIGLGPMNESITLTP